MNEINRNAWKSLLRGLPTHFYLNLNDLEADYDGWVWVKVGHNASHEFYVGHYRDFSQFAMKSCGEGAKEGTYESRVYRQSSTLEATLAGAYRGHF
jgi:hypothetical protein